MVGINEGRKTMSLGVELGVCESLESDAVAASWVEDDAEICETVFLDAMAHDDVVGVGVDAQVVGLRGAEGDDGVESSVERGVGCDAMADHIGVVVVEPSWTGDVGVVWFGRGYECEGGDDLLVEGEDVGVVGVDVVGHGLDAWVCVGPLRWVACAPHCLVGEVENLHDTREVVCCCLSDFHDVDRCCMANVR